MSFSLFGYILADSQASSEGPTPRLRDLILGLLSGEIAAAAVMSRIDPNLADEVRAVVAHRGITAESFLANALMAFALDVADESWRQAIRSREALTDDAEAAALSELLMEVLRQRIEREIAVGGQTQGKRPAMPVRRIG